MQCWRGFGGILRFFWRSLNIRNKWRVILGDIIVLVHAKCRWAMPIAMGFFRFAEDWSWVVDAVVRSLGVSNLNTIGSRKLWGGFYF